MSALHRLAECAGLQIDWVDATGKPQLVSDASLARVLAALGYAAESEAEIATSLEICRAEQAECNFLSADVDEPAVLPAHCADARIAEIGFEDGRSEVVELIHDGRGAVLPPVAEIGYHRLRIGRRDMTIAVAPKRCFGVADAAPSRRIWGPAVQVPALRNGEPRAFGDFGSLADAARAFAGVGADALAISPTHALFPADAGRFSPYAPSSRLFLNILFGDPALIDHGLPPMPGGDLIDWAEAIPARIEALRTAYRARGDGVRQAVARHAAERGEALEHHAVFDALHAHFFDSGAYGWQDWPEEYRDPASPAVEAFAHDNREDVDFFLFAQWLAEASLDHAQRAAREAGMAVGLISDLAVGMDAGGSHGWSRREELLSGLSIGAPPDPLGPDGQDWGITGFSPRALARTGFDGFIATLRAALDHAGGIRIDHALGLRRLWVIPHGAPSSEGAYLTYPLDDMLRIIALESHRAHAIVIGEDLGTVPEGLREALDARDLLGMRVLWFERGKRGRFTPPADWDARAAAMTGTHDLATVAGWWTGRDIDWTWKIGRGAAAESEAEDRKVRRKERKRLWKALKKSKSAKGRRPKADDPAPAVDAALAHVGKTPCPIAIFPMEDVAGLIEQPNLPGTIDEHPNWRRRMAQSTVDMLARPEVVRRVEGLNKTREK